MLERRRCQPKGVSLPRVDPSTPRAAATRRGGGGSPALAERKAGSTEGPPEEAVEPRRTADGRGDGVMATRPFTTGETVMVGLLAGALTGNDAHAT
jgi:hypothetical protein